MIIWNGIQSKSSLVVCARSDVSGSTLTLTVGASTDVAVSTHATLDGVVRLEITGLDADTMYDYTVSSTDSEPDIDGKVRTFPAYGNAPIAVVSCCGNGNFAIARAIVESGAYAVILTGDESYEEDDYFEYLNVTDETNAGATDTPRNALDQESHYRYKREMRDQVTKNWLWTQGVGFGFVVDDHDHFYNDGVDDYTQVIWYAATLGNRDAGYSALTDPMWTTIKGYAANAVQAYSQGNPPNVDALAETDAFYFRFTAGDVEYIVNSQVVDSPTRMRGDYKTGTSATPLMGTDQTAWTQAAVEDSKSPYVCLAMPKATLSNQFANPDTFAAYSDMVDHLKMVSDSGKTTITIGGDYHSAGLFAAKQGIASGQRMSSLSVTDRGGGGNEEFDAVAIIASSCGRHTQYSDEGTLLDCDVRDSNWDQSPPVADTDQTIWACTKANGRSGDRTYIGFGLVSTEEEGYLNGKFINSASELIFEADVKFGTNYLHEGDKVADKIVGLHDAIANNDGITGVPATLISGGDEWSIANGAASSANNRNIQTIESGDYISEMGCWGYNNSGLSDRDMLISLYTATALGSNDEYDPDALIHTETVDIVVAGGGATILDAERNQNASLNVSLEAYVGQEVQVVAQTTGTFSLPLLDNFIDNAAGRCCNDNTVTAGTPPATYTTAASTIVHNPFVWAVISNDGEPTAPTLTTPYPDKTYLIGESVSINTATNISGETSLTVTTSAPYQGGLSETSGTISGTAAEVTGTIIVTVTGTNSYGSVSDSFQLTTLTTGAPSTGINVPINE